MGHSPNGFPSRLYSSGSAVLPDGPGKIAFFSSFFFLLVDEARLPASYIRRTSEPREERTGRQNIARMTFFFFLSYSCGFVSSDEVEKTTSKLGLNIFASSYVCLKKSGVRGWDDEKKGRRQRGTETKRPERVLSTPRFTLVSRDVNGEFS